MILFIGSSSSVHRFIFIGTVTNRIIQWNSEMNPDHICDHFQVSRTTFRCPEHIFTCPAHTCICPKPIFRCPEPIASATGNMKMILGAYKWFRTNANACWTSTNVFRASDRGSGHLKIGSGQMQICAGQVKMCSEHLNVVQDTWNWFRTNSNVCVGQVKM